MTEAPYSYSSSSLRKSKTLDEDHMITESDMEAAQQLMQLSDEDSSNNITVGSKRSRIGKEEEVEQKKPSYDHIIMAKIQEIFGNDIEVFPPKKQRRYRSLENIYMATKPINAGNERRVRA